MENSFILLVSYQGDLCPINQKYISRRFVVSKRYRDAKASLAEQATLLCPKDSVIVGDIKVEIDTYYKRQHDIDAFVKFILDALQGIAYENDSQIQELVVRKHIDKTLLGADIKIIRHTPTL